MAVLDCLEEIREADHTAAAMIGNSERLDFRIRSPCQFSAAAP